jgi:diguanylate cyclase (GGDEF)-like protein
MRRILSPHESSRPLWVAGLVVGLIVLVTTGLLPESQTALPVVQPFVPMYATTEFLLSGFTAYFLAIQFRTSREPFLAALAGAYGFVVVVATVQVLIFPGAFSPNGLLGAGRQSAAWMWLTWHTGYPLFMLAALAVQGLRIGRGGSEILNTVGKLLMVGGPLTAAFLAWVVLADSGRLPQLITGDSYRADAGMPAAPVVLAVNIVAILACVRITRLRDLLSLWVGVALLTSFCDVVLMLTAGARFTLGWYAGQVLSVVSSSVVLCVLIFEFDRLYDRLLTSNVGLTQLAFYDALTGAFNRGYFIEQFPRELRRAVREQVPLSLLMVDVDHFKAYNDHRGHQMGDQCLIAIVAAIRKVARRPADFIARYGGEEFAVVLPGTDSAGALLIAEAVRAEIFDLCEPRGEAALGVVTASLGIATFDPAADAFDAEELIRRADQALYQAKRAGRDRSLVYQVVAA